MQIRTRTAVIPVEAIQAAYNNAVMSGRMALAREIGQLWFNVLVEQKVQRIPIGVGKWRSKNPSDLCTGDEPGVVNRPPA